MFFVVFMQMKRAVDRDEKDFDQCDRTKERDICPRRGTIVALPFQRLCKFVHAMFGHAYA